MPVKVELREHTRFVMLDNGTWSASIPQLDLIGTGATQDEAFDAMRASMAARMTEQQFKAKLVDFIQDRGTRTSTEEYERDIRDGLDLPNEPLPGSERRSD